MKRILAAITLALAAAAAFALPAPAQIEDALATQHYSEARSMINEVLRERPDSARAHLLNSYVLVHVDHNRAAANAELETAKGLDKRGDVKTSPLFGRVVAEIGAAAPAKPTSTKVAPASDGEHGTRVLLIVCGLVALGIGLYLIFRILSDRPASTRVVFVGGGGGYSGPSAAVGGGPGGPWLGSGGNGVLVPQPVFVPQAAPQPMGPLGTAASVAGGVVAGNAISDLLHSRSGSRRDDDWEPRSSRSAPAPEPSPVSYESERSSFSSSSSGSSDWGSSSSSSSSSSDWGSSSSDSSSSYSSDSSSDW